MAVPNSSEFARNSGKAVASVFLGGFSFGLFCIAGIPAVILGIWSLRDITRSRGQVKGRLLANMGIVLGILGSLLPLIVVLVLDQGSYRNTTHDRVQSANNLKSIANASHEYQEKEGSLPQAALMDKDGKPGLSWRPSTQP
jgi:hypothetical protein